MTPLTELNAFFTDHCQYGELDAGVDGPIVWDRVRLRRQHGQTGGRG